MNQENIQHIHINPIRINNNQENLEDNERNFVSNDNLDMEYILLN